MPNALNQYVGEHEKVSPLGQRILLYCHEHKINVKELSRRTGVSKSVLYRITSGEKACPLRENFEKLAKVLGIDCRTYAEFKYPQAPDDKLNRTPLAAWLKVLRHITASGKTPADVLRAIDTLNNFFSGERHA